MAELLIAECVDDVVRAVERARDEGHELTVVCGGHGPWSMAVSDGIRLDLSALSDVEIDGSVVRVGGGATWGRVASTLGAAGLAVSSGDTASVGVGGLTLGGGIGWMVRAWGLAADQLIGAEVVTADGRVIEASADRHADLFWALRGGGGNFGVVTRFDFRAHPLPGIVHGEYPVADDPIAVLRSLREVMRDAPRELTVTYMDVPPIDPSGPAGARVVAVWAGADAERMRQVLAPLERTGTGVPTITSPAYRDILLELPRPAPGEEQPAHPGFLGGNGLFAEIDDDLIDRLVAYRAAHPASVVFLRSLGGAFGDVPQEGTPFPARHAQWFVMAGAFDIPGVTDDKSRAAAVADWRVVESRRLAEYGNFADAERPQVVSGMFGAEALERLREVKRVWDPQNLFRRNHNIEP